MQPILRRLMLAAVLLLTCNIALQAAEPALQRYEYSRIEMATTFRIVLYAADEAVAKQASTAAFARVKQLNAILTDYEATSELSKLSATAPASAGVAVSDELWTILAAGQKLAADSGGAFDLTIGPATHLWRRARRQKELPSAERIAAARRAIGYDKLKLDAKRHTAQLTAADMRLDAGGIAKGYAADEALKVLAKAGITRALVAASGDIVVGDAPPDDARGWRIGIAPLDTTEQPSVYLRLNRAAVSTSGDAHQFVEIGGKRFSHILDPRTGEPLHERASVSIVAPASIQADALATAVCVLGPEAGAKLLQKYPGAGMYFVKNAAGKLSTTQSELLKSLIETQGASAK
jgi:thiamine biosynthesis lipoprotein